jgi:hypothetical protein
MLRVLSVNLIGTITALTDTFLYKLLQTVLFSRIANCNMLVSLTLINNSNLTYYWNNTQISTKILYPHLLVNTLTSI